MKDKRFSMGLLVVCLIILLIVLVRSGIPVQPTLELAPEQPPPPDVEIDPTGYTCDDVKPIESQTQVASNGIFIDKQLLLRGPEEIVKRLAAKSGMKLLRFCHLNYISKDLVTGLYEVSTEVDPQTLSDRINVNEDFREFRNFGVTASPNYLVGPSVGSCVDPYSGGGSSKRTLNAGAGGNMFITQWALKSIGLNQIEPWTGWSNVHVAVFDTMPKSLRPPQTGIADFINDPTSRRRIEWPNPADPTFQLKVYDYLGKREFDAGNKKQPSPKLANHGFFVAGLIRLIAPNSQIHLIRVLGDNGCSDLQKLDDAINEFMGAMHGKKIVINLSLGVHHPPGSNMEFLKQTLKDIHDKAGAVIVAAAGNDSANLTPPDVAQLPASFEFVVGAVASDKGQARACYSNQAFPTPTNPAPKANNLDVAAPGGNGGKNPSGTENCVSRTMTWTATPAPCAGGMGVCGYGVISLINPAKSTTNPNRWTTKFGYWSGTSFSTPFVSGLAALLFQDPSTKNTRVYCLIEKGANSSTPDLGAGVIDISRSLTTAAAGTCP